MEQLTAMRTFSRVVETGSFSEAARDLNISQPSVTRQIAYIEQKFGVRLFNRTTRGVAVTETGALLYERCKRVLHELDEIEIMLNRQNGRLEGVLRISASVSFGHKIISPLLIEFIEANPDIRVDLTCGNPYANLIAQGVDVAIQMGPLTDSSFGSRLLGTNPWAMVASPAYLKARGEPAAVADLVHHEGLIYSSEHNDDVWRHRLPNGERRPLAVRERMRSNNLTAILDAAAAGLGIAMVPLYLAVPALRSGKLVRIMEHVPLHEREIFAVLPSPRLVPPKVDAFIEFMRAKFRENWWQAYRAG